MAQHSVATLSGAPEDDDIESRPLRTALLHLHSSGPEALFGGKDKVINGSFNTLKAMNSGLKQPAA